MEPPRLEPSTTQDRETGLPGKHGQCVLSRLLVDGPRRAASAWPSGCLQGSSRQPSCISGALLSQFLRVSLCCCTSNGRSHKSTVLLTVSPSENAPALPLTPPGLTLSLCPFLVYFSTRSIKPIALGCKTLVQLNCGLSAVPSKEGYAWIFP